ncbi:DUF5707 domain-containing protein [Streptomyces sp. NPDC087859]|uniref:DUF5707 domain-containing protein n=1 Tax=Streptomyces sp. NPDC087859 TaxID=3365812 RepID=UPI0037F6D3A0
MSRRIILSATTAVAVLGAASAFALAQAGEQPPALKDSAVRYTAPAAGHDGSLSFTTQITAPSGLKSLKVLAWPKGAFADKPLTEKDMNNVESATCKPAGDDTQHCTYQVPVTTTDAAEATEAGQDTWYVATLATGKNGDTVFADKSATFTTR